MDNGLEWSTRKKNGTKEPINRWSLRASHQARLYITKGMESLLVTKLSGYSDIQGMIGNRYSIVNKR
ncbi:hypothetical protein A3860_08935 [Niastella vici]|uniref:Uncharacterized protein n=1 Tax=Niastella vici TaxID=1703345 RepID=A0A1V9FHJ8_9BACT|nr:hypothetical protein A3860_08935 [Niastella vici]